MSNIEVRCNYEAGKFTIVSFDKQDGIANCEFSMVSALDFSVVGYPLFVYN